MHSVSLVHEKWEDKARFFRMPGWLLLKYFLLGLLNAFASCCSCGAKSFPALVGDRALARGRETSQIWEEYTAPASRALYRIIFLMWLNQDLYCCLTLLRPCFLSPPSAQMTLRFSTRMLPYSPRVRGLRLVFQGMVFLHYLGSWLQSYFVLSTKYNIK